MSTREAHAGLTVLLGVVALRMGLTDGHLRYVKAAMGPWLVVAGAVLVALGAAALLRSLGDADRVGHEAAAGDGATGGDAAHDAHGGDPGAGHAHAPGVAWLLVLPVLAVFLVYPGPLGAYAAGRQPAAALPVDLDDARPELPAPVDGAVDLRLSEFVRWTYYDDGAEGLAGTPVRLVGFAVAAEGDEAFLLTRFVVGCCAADGRPVQVAVAGLAGPPPPPDTWVEVVGTWQPDGTGVDRDGQRRPRLEATSLREVRAPADPYES